MRPRALIWVLLGVAAAAAAHRWLDVVEVRGNSMAPTLLPGDRLLVAKARPRVGDVVLAPDPSTPTRELIKRVASVDATGMDLWGDNASASTQVRVGRGAAKWRAYVRYWPPARFGLVPSAGAPAGRECRRVAETHVQPHG